MLTQVLLSRASLSLAVYTLTLPCALAPLLGLLLGMLNPTCSELRLLFSAAEPEKTRFQREDRQGHYAVSRWVNRKRHQGSQTAVAVEGEKEDLQLPSAAEPTT